MSVTNLNQFPVHEISLNMNTIQFTVLIVGLIKFLLLHILLHRKRISSFFSEFQSLFCNHKNHDNSTTKNIDFEPLINNQETKRVDDGQSLCSGEVEIVFRSLGMFRHGDEEKLPARLDAAEIFNIFEERNPSLDEVKEAFDVFDSNRDGFIDENELQKVLCALGLKEGLKMENCRKMIGVFDEDGDGRIDFDEFVKFMENSFT